MKNLLVSFTVLLFSFGIVAHAALVQQPTKTKSLQTHAANQPKKRISGIYCGDTTA